MSVAKCFTDFHIDMGGSSVWYHVVKGRKVFWLLPPSPSHLRLFEEWTLARQQSSCFFADLCEKSDCQMVILEAGSTFFLPSGWIHAVYTLEDSLVFGGNFLNSFHIAMQIEIWNLERKIRVPDRFRFPLFIETMWYVVFYYVDRLTKVESVDDNRDSSVNNKEKNVQHSDLNARRTTTQLPSENSQQNIKHSDPKLTPLEIDGLKVLCTFLTKLKDKSIPSDIQQAPELLETMERLLNEHCSDNSQLNITGQSIVQYTSFSHQNESTLKRKSSPMQQSSPYPHPASNIVTLHPSSTILLSGPLANPSYYPSTSYPTNYNQYPTTPSVVYQNDKTMTAKDRHKRVRCKQCEPCCRDDCSECVHCKDMPKFGGVGKMKQCCLTKQCIAPILPSTASCQVCLKKKGSRKLSQLKPDEILYECERCMEIHHLPCFHNGHSDLSTNEGVFSDDIPETWLCPKCINANTPEPPLYKLRPIVRRTLVTTNKGKNGLIEIPYNEPTVVPQYIPSTSQIYQNDMHHFHPIYGSMMNHHQSNEYHPEMYSDPYEPIESESKKRCFYPSMYQTHGSQIDPSQIPIEQATGLNNQMVTLDDLSQSMNDSELYIPPMFAV